MYGSRRRIDFSFVEWTRADLRSERFRFRSFDVRMWLFPDLARLIPPAPVARNRLLAPRFDFIFGMTYPSSFCAGGAFVACGASFGAAGGAATGFSPPPRGFFLCTDGETMAIIVFPSIFGADSTLATSAIASTMCFRTSKPLCE